MRLDAVVLAAALSVQPALVIHGFDEGPSGVSAANPYVRLSVTPDTSIDQMVLLVDYPEPTNNPSGRDVRCTVEHPNWTAGKAIAFQVKPDHPLRLSVSFIDRNGVVYTAWRDLLRGGEWQRVRIPIDRIQPNPYFQPPGAKTDAPIDVSEVRMIAFAPQDKTSGRLKISSLYLSP
jgi:hypothetical protein